MGISALLLAGTQAAAATLIASVWQGLLLAAMIWAVLKLAPKITAGFRFLAWLAVFGVVVLLPILSLVRNYGSSSHLYSVAAAGAPLLQLDSRWALGIVAIWLTALLARASGLIRNAYRLRALWKGSMAVDGGAAIAGLLCSMRFRSAQLCSSTEIDQPCVLGFFAPRIVIPEWLLEKTTAADLEKIVLHEVAHLRRLDDWVNLLQKMVLVVFPLNPVLFWIEKRLCAEREMACDESVVRSTKAPRDYAACLVNLAGQRLEQRRTASLSLGAWEKRPELAGRIQTILRGGGQLHPWKARTLLATLLLAIVSGAAGLGGSSQLVAFTTGSESRAFAGPASTQLRQTQTLGYHDVMFREPAALAPAITKTVIRRHRGHSAALPVAEKKRDRDKGAGVDPIQLNSPVPLDLPARPRTLIMVTQWESSLGSSTTVTLIQTSFRILADPASSSSSGWYVFQL